MKIHPEGVFQCGWQDGQTDMTKIIVAFRNFANGPKNEALYCFYSY
jgi:hypothetical protein